MTENKHTPGPWKYSFESPAVDSVWAIVTDRAGGIIANVNPETGPDATSAPATRKMPADANARLIAAAPTMYNFVASKAASGDNEALAIMGAINGNAEGH